MATGADGQMVDVGIEVQASGDGQHKGDPGRGRLR
jgi:hypothetical protein